jgi:gliding motility-associated-like protein
MQIKKLKYYFLLFILIQKSMICIGQNGFGPPIFRQDFGIGNNDPSTFGLPLGAGKTYFTFSNNGCPPPGSYTIVRRVPVNNCFNNEWIDLGHDNSNTYIDFGMMMVINNNTSISNKIVYVDTVNQTTCEGVEYRFSVAFINLDLIDGWRQCPNSPDYPELELRVEDGMGNLIAKDTTPQIISHSPPRPPIPNYFFTEFPVDFIMPAGINKMIVKVTLLHSHFECAEDFAIDDIQLRPRGPNTVIKFNNEPPTTVVKAVCFQHNTSLSMTGTIENYYSNTVLQWQQSMDYGVTWTDIPGATSLTYSRAFPVPDTFLFRLTGAEAINISNPNCRVASNILKVEVDGLPTGYTITSNSPICSGHDLMFNATGATSYIWTGPNGFYDNISYPHIFFSTLADSGWYYVDVFSRGGCVKRDSTHATVIGTDVHAGPDTMICKGRSAQLTASPGVSYSWTPATGLSATNIRNPRAKPEVTTAYIVEVTDNMGCSDTAHVEVRVLNKIEVKADIAGTDYLCRSYDSASFKDRSTGNITTWSWNFGNGQTAITDEAPVQYYSIPANDDNYIVRLAVADTSGCTDTAYHSLKVLENCYIAVPTAFTPNGDGLNDYLYPVNAYKATHLLFTVFNRNGQVVFESRDWSGKWDGRIKGILQASDVYVWMLEYNDPSGKKISLKGTTVLIR